MYQMPSDQVPWAFRLVQTLGKWYCVKASEPLLNQLTWSWKQPSHVTAIIHSPAFWSSGSTSHAGLGVPTLHCASSLSKSNLFTGSFYR